MQSSVGFLNDGMFCNGIWRICRDSGHLDSIFGTGFQIDIVETGTAQQDQSDTVLMQDFNDFRRSLIVHKDTYRIETLCQRSRLHRQP